MSCLSESEAIETTARLGQAGYIPEYRQAAVPVRVCFLIDMLRVGGTETHLLNLIKGLDRSRVIPHLCLLDGTSDVSRQLEPADCEVHRLGVTRLARLSTLPKLFEFKQRLRAWKIDALQVHFPDSTYFGVAGGLLAGVKAIVRTRRDLFYWVTPAHRRFGRLLDGFYNFAAVDALLANSQAVAHAVRQSERPSPRQITIIENGVDMTKFTIDCAPSFTSPGATVRVGMVAMLRPEKRVDLLLSAAQLVVQAQLNIEFEVAGEGACRGELLDRIAELGMQNQFTLSGIAKDVPSFLSCVDICVLCSDTEGQSNALIEYMAAGRAVIATDVGGNRDIVQHGINGLLVPPGSSSALADAIKKLAASPELRASIGANARRHAVSRFSQDAMLRKYESFYSRIVRRSKSASRLS